MQQHHQGTESISLVMMMHKVLKFQGIDPNVATAAEEENVEEIRKEW